MKKLIKRKILAVFLLFTSAFICAFGLAACNRSVIKSALINVDGELELTLNDDSVVNLGAVTRPEDADGVWVSDAGIDGNGKLTIKLISGEEVVCDNYVDPSATSGLNFCAIENGAGYAVDGIQDASDTEIVLPAWRYGKPVTGIADKAFEGAENLTGVTIPDSVTYVGEYAFYGCTNLKSVTAGIGIKSAGQFAFGKCSSLESVYINSVSEWCNIGFANAASNPLYFAHKLYVNGELASHIVIPDSVTTIGDFAFYELDDLQSVDTGNGATRIGEHAFFNCINLGSVSIGNGVTEISECAFLGCGRLESAVMGKSVKSIGGYAFYQCSSLKSIEIPSSVKIIGESAFAECYDLQTVILNEGLEVIEDNAFTLCASLKSFKMPSSVTRVGFGVLMFRGGGGGGFGGLINSFSDLTELTLSDNLTEIPDFAFSGCNISSIVIGSKVNKISYSAFYSCAALESIVIPKSVERIVSYAFYNCNALNSVYYAGTEQEWKKISIGKNGNSITDDKVTVYYYSETKPDGAGNFWHYVDGKATVWEQ